MIAYLHVPHTGGRVLQKYLQTSGYINTQIRYIHGTRGIERIHRTGEKVSLYFILRNPIDRIIGEFLHYSKLLKETGRVAYLQLDKIIKVNPNFDPLNPYHYIQIESGHNMYCKYLLLKTDFSVPITDNDFLLLRKKLSEIKFDYYDTPLTHPVLSDMIGIDKDTFKKDLEEIVVDSLMIPNDDYKKSLLSDTKLIDQIKKCNSYDMKLFDLLTNK